MKIGFLINPIAGMGGKVALKGTDGEETLRRAIELGAVPSAHLRAEAALKEFAPAASDCEFLAPAGAMGADLLQKYFSNVRIIYSVKKKSTPYDTKNSVRLMMTEGADLIAFAGGDGTARDICSVVGESVPVVGIPAGVKIHSGVYAKHPKDAGMLIKAFIESNVKKFTESEVMDIDEDAFRNNMVRARLYGYMKTPDDRRFMQDRKSGSGKSDAVATGDIAAYIASTMKKDALYLVGSGTTTAAVLCSLGIKGTLLGVDAVRGKKLIGKDLSEDDIKKLLAVYPREQRYLIITIIGGQGYIFGRGNQQLSPEVIRMIPKENIKIIASPSKMAQLFEKSLIVDTGDTSLDEEFSGYVRVITGFGIELLTKVA